MNELVLLAFPPIMFYLNWVRGSHTQWLFDGYGLSGVGKVVSKVFPNGAPLAGIGLLALMFAYTMDPIASLVVAVVYLIFESFGWAKWIRNNNRWFDKTFQAYYNVNELPRDTGKSSGVHQIANAIFKEDKDFTSYGITALIIRGIWWYLPIYVALVAFKLVTIPIAIMSVLVIAILFPVSYWVGCSAKRFAERPDGVTHSLGFHGMEEKYYGLVQGIVLAISIYLGS